MSLGDEIDHQAETAELRAALRRAEARAAKREGRHADLVQAVYEAAKDASLALGTPKPVPAPSRDRRRSPEVALLHLTDWQLGKHTVSYNPDVCERRVHEAARKTIRISDIYRADHPVREVHVMLGGDLIEGVTVFPGQAHEVETGMFEQVMRAAGIVESTILALLEGFERVYVHEVWGNHGRIGRRGDVPREDNWDRMVGVLARQRLEQQSRITWGDASPSWYRVLEIGDYRPLLVHGDQIKSFGGNVPAYGILRKANAWAAGAIKEHFHSVFLGHFHTPMQLAMANGQPVFVTGSTESDNEYAREFVAARGRPSQRLMFVDPRKARETGSYTLWLD